MRKREIRGRKGRRGTKGGRRGEGRRKKGRRKVSGRKNEKTNGRRMEWRRRMKKGGGRADRKGEDQEERGRERRRRKEANRREGRREERNNLIFIDEWMDELQYARIIVFIILKTRSHLEENSERISPYEYNLLLPLLCFQRVLEQKRKLIPIRFTRNNMKSKLLTQIARTQF